MVKIMAPNPIKMDDLGGFSPPIFGSTPISRQFIGTSSPPVDAGHPLNGGVGP